MKGLEKLRNNLQYCIKSDLAFLITFDSMLSYLDRIEWYQGKDPFFVLMSGDVLYREYRTWIFCSY